MHGARVWARTAFDLHPDGRVPQHLIAGLGLVDRDALLDLLGVRCHSWTRLGDLAVGETVGYGGLWRAERRSRVAILPVGYADGYLRGAQPGAVALVRGVRVPLVGVISMDALAVDVTDIPGVDAADTFVLLGSQGGESITAGDLARSRNTIAWEVLSSMAARLDRVYYPEAGQARQDE